MCFIAGWRRIVVLGVALGLPCLAARAPAATIYWDGSGTTWNAASSWSTNINGFIPNPTFPPGALDVAVFNTTPINTPQTVNLDAAQSAGGLTFRSTGTVLIQTGAGSNTLTLDTGSITVISGAGANTISSGVGMIGAQAWTNNSSSLLTVSGDISNGGNLLTVDGPGETTLSGALSGFGGLTKIGAGTLRLSGNNSFSGPVSLESGAALIGSNSAFGLGSLALYSGITMQADGGPRTVTNGMQMFGGVSFGGDLTFSNSAFMSGTTTMTVGNSGVTTFAGDIAAAGPPVGVIKAGAGTLVLSGNNLFGGGTTVGAGTLQAGSNSAFGTGALTIDGGTADLQTFTPTVSAINLIAGGLSLTGNFTAGTGGLLGASPNIATNQIVTVTGTTTIDPFRSLTLSGGALNTGNLVANGALVFTSGTLGITGSGGLEIGSGGPLGSTVTLGSGRTLNVTNTTTINSGALLALESGAGFSSGNLQNSGELLLDGAAATATGTTVNNAGLIRGEGRIIAIATTTNSAGGEIRAETGKRIKLQGANGSNAGKINLQGGTAEFTQTLTNGTAGQIEGRGTLITGGAGLTNAGNLALSSGITDVFGDVNNSTGSATKGITISGNADVTFWDDVANGAGSLFKVSSGSSVTVFGTYSGAGISGTGNVYYEADVSPGFSPASVDYGGNVILDSTASLKIELGGTMAGTYDQMHVAGQLTLDGTLDIDLIGGFVPQVGDSFDILDSASRIGTFSMLDLPALGPGLAWDTTNLYSGGVLASLANNGDYDDDGNVDADDIDILWHIVRGSGTDPNNNNTADLDGSTLVNEDDVDTLLATKLNPDAGNPGSRYGDADLDDDVDGTDFDRWRTRPGYTGAGTGRWAAGDWDGDGDVDGTDFDLWRTRPTQYPSTVGPHGHDVASVPEPSTLVFIGLGMAFVVVRHLRRTVSAPAADSAASPMYRSRHLASGDALAADALEAFFESSVPSLSRGK